MGEGYVDEPGLTPQLPPGIWVRWDANYYFTIATESYAQRAEVRGFFPLYPLLLAGVSRLIGDIFWAGMIIAQLSYLAALLGFYRLARLLRDEHAYALWAVVSLAVFPTAFFYFAWYAESLYLALSVWGLYFFMRPRTAYVRAGLALAFASLTRPIGWLLTLIVASEYWFRLKLQGALSFWRTSITLALAVAGTVLFVVYLYTVTGTFTAITQSQALWQRHWEWPWMTVLKSLHIAMTGSRVPGNWFLYAINLADLLATLFAIALTGVALYRSLQQRFPASLTVYLLCMLVFTLSSEGPYYQGSLVVVPLWGMTRWVVAMFPLFLVLSDVLYRRKLRWVYAALSLLLMVGLTAWWTTGRWVG
jgi:hypothetical protein